MDDAHNNLRVVDKVAGPAAKYPEPGDVVRDIRLLASAGILKSIDEAFDGHTVDGLCEGVYKMDDGRGPEDNSRAGPVNLTKK